MREVRKEAEDDLAYNSVLQQEDDDNVVGIKLSKEPIAVGRCHKN